MENDIINETPENIPDVKNQLEPKTKFKTVFEWISSHKYFIIFLILVLSPGVFFTFKLHFIEFKKPQIEVRASFKQGEVVKYSIINRTNSTISFSFNNPRIERFKGNNWSEVSGTGFFCPCGAICDSFSTPTLSPGETSFREWNQIESWCKGKFGDKQQVKPVSPGKYRVVFNYIYGSSPRSNPNSNSVYHILIDYFIYLLYLNLDLILGNCRMGSLMDKSVQVEFEIIPAEENVNNNQTGSTTQPTITQPKEAWSKPLSKTRAVPHLKEGGSIYLYSLDNKELKKTDYAYESFSSIATEAGEEDFNESQIVKPSPNFLYTTFCSAENDLQLISNQTLESRKIVSFPDSIYNYVDISVVDWSPDSSRFIYFIGEVVPLVASEKKDAAIDLSGFHLFNIETGEDILLAPLDKVSGGLYEENIRFLDNSRIIFPLESAGKSKFGILDLNNSEVDDKTINDSFSGFFSLTKDGKKWARHKEDPKNEDSSYLVFADFPNSQGETIATNSDSEGSDYYYNPIVSPNGKYIALTKAVFVGGDLDEERDFIKFWDTSSKSIIDKEVPIDAEVAATANIYWIDDQNIYTDKGIFNLETGKLQDI
jgi:hypothetical protein